MALSVAFLGPAGTYTEEALLASAREDVSPEARSTVYETVMSVQDGQTDRAVVPIENSLEGGVAATLDALGGRGQGVRIAAEVVHPIHHCLSAARELARPRCGGCSRIRRPPPSAPGSYASGCRAPSAWRRPRPPRRCASSRGSDEPWAALGSRLAAAAIRCAVLAERVEDRPTTSPASCGSRGPVRQPRAGRRPEDLDRLLGLQRLLSGRARRRAAGVLGPRDQPHEDRVAPPPRAARPLHVLRGPRRAADEATSPRRSRRSGSGSRRSGCSARTPSGPASRRRPLATLPAPWRPAPSGSSSGGGW